MANWNYIKRMALAVLFVGHLVFARADNGYLKSPNYSMSPGSQQHFGRGSSNEEALRYLLYYMSQMPSSRSNHPGSSSLERGVKRYGIGSEFLGKRAISLEPGWHGQSEETATDGERQSLELLEKRMGSEFLGKRMGSEFLGKRMGSEFLGKRMGSEFLGKRMGSEFLGKRMGSEFLGKRILQPGFFSNEADPELAALPVVHTAQEAEDIGSRDVSKELTGDDANRDITFVPQSAIISRGVHRSPNNKETDWDNERAAI